jgi:AcrR family transcriptional regulator
MDAAFECFNYDGIRGVSADTIIDRAGVAKMTLYKHYPTKDILASAYVHARSDQWLAWLKGRVKQLGRTPKQRLHALFTALDEWFQSADYFGCPFHRSAAEFPDRTHPVHQEVIRNKRQLREFVAELVADAGLRNQAHIVTEFVVLMAGAEVMVNIEGLAQQVERAHGAAAWLMRRNGHPAETAAQKSSKTGARSR